MPYREMPLEHDAIKCIWHTERMFTADNPVFEVLPDGFAELIFFFGATCFLYDEANTLVPVSSPFLVGLLDKPLRFKIEGHIRIFALRLYPWAAFSFLQVAPNVNGNVQLSNHAFGHLTESLRKQEEESSVSAALQSLHDFFLARDHSAGDFSTGIAGKMLLAANGAIATEELAGEAHVSVRTLQRKFLQSSGNSAKAVARKIRFEKVRNHIWFHPHCNLAGLAYEYGYTDQAHLTHEFKELSGKTPKVFAKEAVQAARRMAANSVVFLQDTPERRG